MRRIPFYQGCLYNFHSKHVYDHGNHEQNRSKAKAEEKGKEKDQRNTGKTEADGIQEFEAYLCPGY